MNYHRAGKDQKSAVAESGLRTDLEFCVDRKHPESLVPSIPLGNIVFDAMHGLTRIFEKLLSLEIEKILSEGNKIQQSQGMKDSSKQLLDNLVSNINKRGVRQGNFKIRFDKSGKLEQITLNKDHAFAILSPAPAGRENDFPHVLENVVSNRPLLYNFPDNIKDYIGAQDIATENDAVNKMWECVFNKYVVLKDDPPPKLLLGKPDGSLHPEDYSWGYSQPTKMLYKRHAECFYQLFCKRYTWRSMTPYMVKFIDYARFFMEYSEFPMSRFQAEGGEHLNYVHNCFYFQHTTRHGGKVKIDPHFSLLSTMYRKLSYEICSLDSVDDYKLFVMKHLAACKIQALFRGYLTRKVLAGPNSQYSPENSVESHNLDLDLSKLHSMQYPPKSCILSKPGIFADLVFVLVGCVPSQLGCKWTQDKLEKEISSHGGCTSKNLPGNSKGRSTKMYHILVNGKTILQSNKVPDVVREAVHRRFIILDYSYIFQCIKENNLLDQNLFKPDVSTILKHVNQEPTLNDQHFSKKARMISLIKKPRRSTEQFPRNTGKQTVEPNAAILYANLKRKEFLDSNSQRISFLEQNKMFGQFCRDFTTLSTEEKKQISGNVEGQKKAM